MWYKRLELEFMNNHRHHLVPIGTKNILDIYKSPFRSILFLFLLQRFYRPSIEPGIAAHRPDGLVVPINLHGGAGRSINHQIDGIAFPAFYLDTKHVLHIQESFFFLVDSITAPMHINKGRRL